MQLSHDLPEHHSVLVVGGLELGSRDRNLFLWDRWSPSPGLENDFVSLARHRWVGCLLSGGVSWDSFDSLLVDSPVFALIPMILEGDVLRKSVVIAQQSETLSTRVGVEFEAVWIGSLNLDKGMSFQCHVVLGNVTTELVSNGAPFGVDSVCAQTASSEKELDCFKTG